MSKLIPTFVRENGKVFAFFEGHVIAEGAHFAKVEETALDYLENLSKERKAKDIDKQQKAATHITTPNGLKGEILGRVEGQWGDKELTVRFENGRIAKFTAHGEDQIAYSNERVAAAPSNPIEALQAELDADFERDRGSLTARIASLDGIVREVTSYISKGASYLDESKLNKIALAATHEKGELTDALEYLKQADAEAFQSDNTYGYGVTEQAEMGGAKDNSWLDATVQDMIDEAEGENYDKILAEEPAQLTAELDSGTLADQGSTAEVALAHIIAKTAAFMGAEVEAYREKFVAATELARRVELKDRQETNHKVAATEEEESSQVPDDSLFL